MKKNIKNIILIILISSSFMVLDIGIRSIDNCLNCNKLIPLFFTVSYIIVYNMIIFLLPKKISKIIHMIVVIIMNIFVFALYLHYLILGRFFDIYDIFLVGQGSEYFGYVFKQIDIKIILIMLSSIIFMILSIILINKCDYDFKIKKNRFLIFLLISLVCFSRLTALTLMDRSVWNYYQSSRNIYDSFNNLNKSMQVSGLYEYIFRSSYLFVKDSITFDKQDTINKINKYYDDSNNISETNNYTGMFKDKNLIFVLLESIDSWMVSEDVMPNLSYMQDTGLNFTNRYAPTFGTGRTINSEFSANTGLYALSHGHAIINYDNKYLYSLPSMFKNNGYKVNSIHANKGEFYKRNEFHLNIGFSKHYSIMDIDDTLNYMDDTTLTNDEDIFNLIIDTNNKFMTYITTISAHLPYDSSNILCTSDDEDICLKSLASATDNFLGNLIKRLDENELLNDTVIVLFSDHFNYGYSNMDYIYEYNNTDKYNLLDKIPFVIWSNDIVHKDIDILMDTADITPTLLNMFDISYDSRNYIGTDVFNSKHENFVYFNDGSWYDGNIYYDNSYQDDINDYIIDTTSKVNKKIELNDLIIKSNYYENR